MTKWVWGRRSEIVRKHSLNGGGANVGVFLEGVANAALLARGVRGRKPSAFPLPKLKATLKKGMGGKSKAGERWRKAIHFVVCMNRWKNVVAFSRQVSE